MANFVRVLNSARGLSFTRTTIKRLTYDKRNFISIWGRRYSSSEEIQSTDKLEARSYYDDEDHYGLNEMVYDEGSQKSNWGSKINISTLKAAEDVGYYIESEGVSLGDGSKLKKWSPPLTKIVATIGPTSEQFDVMQKLVSCGLRVMRLNFSHATRDEVELRVKNLSRCVGRHSILSNRLHGTSNLRATLLDTRGPEIRTGKLRNDTSGKESIDLEAGNTINLRTGKHWMEAGSTENDLFIDYEKLTSCISPGMKVILDDGAVILTVESVSSTTHTVSCRIDNSSSIRSRAGVNIPGAVTDLPALTEKDKADIKYGLTKDIDYIAASFVQNGAGVRDIRRYVRHIMTNDFGLGIDAPAPLIISKIESVAALRNFDEILRESDGIMVARGDLGTEIPIQQVTNAQKEMVAACNVVGKPVIVATQMLESMAKNPRPTRAEVADVTNAVYDGADCVMLSGETAKGKYPVSTVKMMNDIIFTAERFAKSLPELSGGYSSLVKGKHIMSNHLATAISTDKKIASRSSLAAVAKAAVMAAEERNVKAIIVLTLYGFMPRLISAHRPNVPIITFCPTQKLARQLILHRGVHPVLQLPGITGAKKALNAIKDSKELGFVSPGDEIVVVALDPMEGIGHFASMTVCTVPPDELKKGETIKTTQQLHPACF